MAIIGLGVVVTVLALTSTGQAQVHGFTDRSESLVSAAGTLGEPPPNKGVAVEVNSPPRLVETGRRCMDLENTHRRQRSRDLQTPVRHTAVGTPPRGILQITADNAYRAYLNGRLVGHNAAFSINGPDSFTWSRIYRYFPYPQPGHNQLRIQALNHFGPAQPPDNPGGVIFKLRVSFECPGSSSSHS